MLTNESTAIANFGSLLDSEMICVWVGQRPEPTKLYCHRSALSKSESDSLKALVSGKYKEGRGDEGINWKVEDVETVKRLLTFLYTGDYHVPNPKPIISIRQGEASTPTPIPAAKKEGESDEENSEARPLTPIARHLKEVRLPVWRINTEAGNLEYMDRKGRNYRYSEAFLAHAKVFVIADYHQLQPLMTLSLQRLTQCMVYAEPGSQSLQDDIIPLINYTYHGGEARPAQLRNLVVQYAALHFHDFHGDAWDAILEEGGAFMREVTPRVSRRLISQEIKAGGVRGRLAGKQVRARALLGHDSGANVTSLSDSVTALAEHVVRLTVQPPEDTW